MKKLLLLLIVMSIFLMGCSENNSKETDKETSLETKAEKPVGKFMTKTLWSKNLALDWNVSSYVPEDFDPETVRVIYMLHGAFGNHTNYNERTKTIEYLNKFNSDNDKKLIAVFVDGFNSFYIDKNIKIESAIMEDLIPQFEKENNLNINKDRRYIAGISMGGYGAINLSFKHSDIFSKVFAISPVLADELDPKVGIGSWNIFKNDNGEFDKEAYQAYHPLTNFEDNKEVLSDLEIYLVTGNQDKTVPIEYAKKFLEKVKGKVKIKENFIDGDHNWQFWDAQIKDILENIIK